MKQRPFACTRAKINNFFILLPYHLGKNGFATQKERIEINIECPFLFTQGHIPYIFGGTCNTDNIGQYVNAAGENIDLLLISSNFVSRTCARGVHQRPLPQ